MVQFGDQWLLVALACVVWGCGKEESPYEAGTLPATATAIGELQSIPAANVTLGFHSGRLRDELPVAGFRISRFPVVQSQYKQCVAAGACSADADECWGIENSGGLPEAEVVASCVGVANAEAFCAWVGARLPTVAEWMLASRGPAVSRFSWGNDAPSCEHHAEGVRALSEEEVGLLEREASWPQALGGALRRARLCPSAKAPTGQIKQHAEGASPFGVEDVLLTRSELVISGTGSPYNSCRNVDGTCQVTRGVGAEITNLEPIARSPSQANAESATQPSQPTYSFRCAWDGKSTL